MKNLTRIILSLMLALAMLTSVCVCAETAVSAIELTDMTDRAVKLEKPAERIVVITASCAEIVYALGAGDKVVGRGEYCDYPAEILELPSVNSGYETNIEAVIALNPDLVIMDTMAQMPEQVEALENAGIAVLVTAEAGIDGIYTAMDLIGQAVGKQDEAAAIIEGMKKSFADMTGRFAGKDIKVYIDIEPEAWGLYTCGNATFIDEVVNLLGMTNVFGEHYGWMAVSGEQVIAANPDLIVTLNAYDYEGMTPIEEVKARAGWDVIESIAKDHVYQADNSSMTRPGPRLVDAAFALCDYVASVFGE